MAVKLTLSALSLSLLLLAGCGGSDDGQPHSLPAATVADQAVMPTGASQLTWTTAQKIVGHRNMDTIFTSHLVEASGYPSTLPKQPNFQLTYTSGQTQRSIEDFLTRTNGTSLLAIKNGRIVYEQYANGNTEQNAASSRSMAKSILSIGFGLAVKDGLISSLDDKVSKYVPELQGTMYAQVSLRQMLQMTSGVPYYENPNDPASRSACPQLSTFRARCGSPSAWSGTATGTWSLRMAMFSVDRASEPR